MKVLLVTYSFPPAGGVGVLRATSLARYFPGQGIELDVLTTRNASAVGSDPGLLRNIPDAVGIHRTFTLDLPFTLKKWLKKAVTRRAASAKGKIARQAGGRPGIVQRIVQEFLVPDPQITWLPILGRAARRIIRERGIELVLITVPPFSSLMLVDKLRQKFPDLPIVVDFRDEWLSTTLDLVSFSRSRRARKIAQRTEAAAVAGATAVVTVTEAARALLRSRYPQQPAEKFHLVPNGFDASRLPTSIGSTTPRRDGKTLLTYIGTLYGSTDPTSLIEAIRTSPVHVRQKLLVRFIGRIEEDCFRRALLALGDTVELHGFLPQSKALEALCESDYALLITHDPVNISAKFYDYVGAGKPILAVVHPDGAVRQMLEGLRAGWWADSRSVADIRRLLAEAVERCSALRVQYRPERAKIRSYERKALADRYACLLEEIVAAQRQEDQEWQLSALATTQE